MKADGRVTACILAGGRGSRMGGIDKGLMEWRGRPLIETQLAAIAPQVDVLMINANRNQERYRCYGHPVVADEVGGFPGPLAGIAACMAAADTEYVVTLPCDAPRLPPDYVARLRAALEAGAQPVAVAHDGRHLQPVHALLRVTLLPRLRAALARDERKVAAWYADVGFVIADFSDRQHSFFNINRPGDRDRRDAGTSGVAS